MSEAICPRPEELSAFLLGTLPEPVLEKIAQHLDGCPACEAAVNALDRLSDPLLTELRRASASARSSITWIGPRGRDTPGPGPDVGPPLPEQLGDYRIVRELGRGGMGIVYEAEQVSLGRRVALKVLPGHALLDHRAIERFRREARAAGRLHHTNIVPVFGTGERDGLHYFVMQLIPGPSLDEVLGELRRLRSGPPATAGPASAPSGERPPATDSAGPVRTLTALVRKLQTGWPARGPGGEVWGSDPEHEPAPGPPSAGSTPAGSTAGRTDSARAYWVSVARLGVQVADALAFAHAQGVVHRDVKPSNLLLDPHGRLWITDFGLAKWVADAGAENLTRSDLLVGTLRYVPPERFHGSADARGDVYGLGITLYELLTLRPAFPETDREKLLHQVMNTEPPRPRRLNPAIPRDLETILLKAIARDPTHRYQTATDLADDLRRFVEDRPIRARRFTGLELLWRAARRDPVRAALVGSLLLACLAGTVGVTTQWWRAEDRARRAEQAEDQARRSLYFNRIAQARLEWRLNNVAGAEQLLDLCEPEQRGWEWYYLRGVNRPQLHPLPTATIDMLLGVAFSPDGRLLAYTGWSPYRAAHRQPIHAVEVWDLDRGRRLPTPPGLTMGLRVSFSPDGQLLAVTDSKGRVLIWHPSTGKQVALWSAGERGRPGGGGTATFSPDGKLLALGGSQEVTFWEVPAGRLVRHFSSPGGRVTFSPDGKYVAVSGPQAVEVREAITGKEVRRLPHGPDEAKARPDRYFGEEGPDLAFSPDGDLLVVATPTPRLWDLRTGRLLHTLLGHAGDVAGVAFGPDGRHVATAGADGTVRLWDVLTGGERMLWRGHRHWASQVSFHPDGWRLASVGRQPGDVELWDLTRDPEYLSVGVQAEALRFEAGGDRLQTVSGLGDLQDWEVATGNSAVPRRLDLTQEWWTPACLAAFSGDGRRLVTISSDRQVVKLLDAARGQPRQALRGLSLPAIHVAINHDGGRVAALGWERRADRRDREVRAWDAATGETLCVLRPASLFRPALGAVALSPDGAHLAFDDYSGDQAQVRVVAAADGQELWSLPLAEAPIHWITFSADGQLLAAVDQEGAIGMWEVHTGQPRCAQHLRGPSFRLAFSPDGSRLAAADRDQAKVWDVATGGEILTLRGAPPRPFDAGFNPVLTWSPDGRRLAATVWNGSVSIWDATDREPASAPAALRQAVGRAYHWHLRQAEEAAAAGQTGAASFHLERLLRCEPPDVQARLRRAALLARRGQLPQATADFATAFAAHPPNDGLSWQVYAHTLLARGDAAGYRRLCARLWARPVPRFDRHWQGFTARICALGPGGAGDTAQLVQWTKTILAKYPGDPGLVLTLGLAHYRAGQWDQAVARLQEVSANPAVDSLSWPALALAHHRLAHTAAARHWLAKSATRHQEWTRRLAEPGGGFALPAQWPEFEALYAEARRLVPGDEPGKE